ncbi:MAG: hypothetical protein ABSB35_33180 [Bryobacteraceae bacterium]|jgi:hypothetical protein
MTQTETTALAKKAVALQKRLIKAWEDGDQSRFDKLAFAADPKVLTVAKALMSASEKINVEELFCPKD